MDKREEGWYWVKAFGGWECAEYTKRTDGWIVRDETRWVKSHELRAIGPRIEPPEVVRMMKQHEGWGGD